MYPFNGCDKIAAIVISEHNKYIFQSTSLWKTNLDTSTGTLVHGLSTTWGLHDLHGILVCLWYVLIVIKLLGSKLNNDRKRH